MLHMTYVLAAAPDFCIGKRTCLEEAYLQYLFRD